MRRLIAWLAGLAGLVLLLLLVAGLLLPRALDSHAVRDRIRAFVLSKVDADLGIGKLDFTWLPRPTVIMRNVSVAHGKEVTGKIQSITVRPGIVSLLRGQLDISRVEVGGLALSLTLPEAPEKPLDPDKVEAGLRDLIASLTAQAPGLIVAVSGSSIDVRVGARPPLTISDLNGRLVAPPGALDVRASARSNAFDSLRLELGIAGDSLATTGRARFERLRVPEALATLSSRPLPYLESGDMSLDVALTSVGFRKIQGAIDGAAPSLALVRGQRRTVIDGITLKAAVREDEGTVRVTIERLDVRLPRVRLTGELTVDQKTGVVASSLTARDVDLSRIRASALELAQDVQLVDDIAQFFKGGQAQTVGFRSSGRSWEELSRNARITATIQRADLAAPKFDINVSDVRGSLTIAHGILDATGVSARSGRVQGTGGTFRLGLTGPSAPFKLDMKLQADAAELHALLLRTIRDADLHRTLSSIHGIGGRLSGRLVLGERLGALIPRIFVSRAQLNASYDPIPYPLSIQGGSFEYGAGEVAIHDARGTVGRSSFSELTGTLRYGDSPRITVESAKLSIDLAQARNAMSRVEGLPAAWQRLEDARGRLDVTALSFEGPLSDPAAWSWSGAGALHNIVIRHADLPGVLNVSGGTFKATPKELAVSGTSLELLDASMTVDGVMAHPGTAPLDVEASGTGSVGAQMIAWLKREIDMPERFTPRAPVRISDGRLRSKGGDDISFQGDLVVGGGPQLAVDLVRGPHAVEVRQATITDGAHTARVAVELGKGKAQFSFSGILDQATLDRMFEAPPLADVPIEAGLIEGDLEVSAFVEAPVRLHARGRLVGRDFRVPVAGESVHVESFAVEGDQSRVDVRSMDLRWRDRHVTAQGRVEGDQSALRVDLDVWADRIVGDELRDLLERGTERAASDGATEKVLPSVEGVIRVKADEFTFDRFTWKPLQAQISLAPRGVTTEIQRGLVCGISTVGTLDVAGGEVALDLTASATDGSLDTASVCLTQSRRVSGLYSLQARVAGRGDPEQVGRALSGEFEINARDGQFLQSPTVEAVIEKTFDYLNDSGDFEVAFPDLHREAFPFQLASARGRVDGLTLVLDDVVIESSRISIGGSGRLDFENGTIDARGVVSYRIPGGSITGRIPVVGSLLSGEALGIPVRVTGSLSNPDVRYLSAADVGDALLSIPMRILRLPRDAIRMFTPGMRRR